MKNLKLGSLRVVLLFVIEWCLSLINKEFVLVMYSKKSVKCFVTNI